MEPIGYITRIEKFSACHRLHSCHLNDEENLKIYGKCNNLNGHGHNYTLEVTVKGPINKETGMVMNISDMKVLIDEVVMKTMDHKHLDKDVAEFRDNKIVTTTENVAVFIYESVKNRLPDGLSLYEIKLHETDKNVVVFRGE
ncbi:UNVERIFIED_CONTAM: hypothetical protein RMT77_005617 [Armadillidium vulgare]